MPAPVLSTTRYRLPGGYAIFRRGLPRIAIVTGLLGTLLGPATAATDIQGQPEDMQLRVENASIREVLDALSGKFKLTYRLPSTVGRQLTGRYTGNLNQILTRVLDGNDYIVEVTEDGITIVILSTSGASAQAASKSTPTASESQPPLVSVSDSSQHVPVPTPPLTRYLPTTEGLGSNSSEP